MNKIFYPISVFLINAGLILFSYGAISKMYFWHDDYTILYYAQQQGPFSWPYFWIVESAKFLLKIFGLNSLPFFVLELILYLFITLAISYLVFVLTKSKVSSLLSGALFSAGSLGSRGIFVVLGTGINSLFALLLLVLCFIFYFFFLSLKHKRFYILAITSFFLLLETVPVRAHFSLPALLLFDYFFSPNKNRLLLYTVKALKKVLPFTAVYFIQYVLTPSKWIFHYSFLENRGFGKMISLLWQAFNLKYILNYFGSFWNLFFPDDVLFTFLHESVKPHFSIEQLLGKNYFSVLQIGLGMVLFFLVSTLIVFLRKRGHDVKTLIFSFLLLNLFLLAFYPLNSDLIFPTEHRYLLYALFPLSIFLGSLYNQCIYFTYRVLHKVLPVVLILPIVFNAMITHNRVRIFLEQYTAVAETLYSQLLEKVPDFDEKVLFVIRSSDKDLRLRVGDAMRVGFLPSEAALAVHYGKDISNFKLVESIEDASAFLRDSNDFQLSHLRSFDFRDGELFEDTTDVLSSLPNQ